MKGTSPDPLSQKGGGAGYARFGLNPQTMEWQPLSLTTRKFQELTNLKKSHCHKAIKPPYLKTSTPPGAFCYPGYHIIYNCHGVCSSRYSRPISQYELC